MIERAVEILRSARRVLAITGAGVSADSGLPTYRGVGGLYDGVETEEGVPIEVALSAGMFKRNPRLTWKYMAQIESACRGAVPNRAHEVLALLERRHERFCILTQNVDGLHKDAGSSDVIEIHGELRKLYCVRCREQLEVRDYSNLAIPPRCACGGMMRPDVVLFEEPLDPVRLEQLESALEEGVDAVMSIGTSALFPYIVQPVLLARRMGIPTIEINPAVTEISGMVDVRIEERAASALDRIHQGVSLA